jgi:hypothetical protein
VLVLLGGPAYAVSTLSGRVVHVIDGDGLVLLIGERRVNVRLEQIDAPEQRQPYGIAARQSLTAVCGGQLAEARISGKDREWPTTGPSHLCRYKRQRRTGAPRNGLGVRSLRVGRFAALSSSG